MAVQAVLRSDTQCLGAVRLEPVSLLMQRGPRQHAPSVASFALARRDDLGQIRLIVSERMVSGVTRGAVNLEVRRLHG